MFRKLLTLFIVLGFAAAAASWLSAQPGALQVEWLGWRMEMPTSLAVAFVGIFLLVLVFFDRLLRALRGMPRWLGGRLHQRRDVAGYRALTMGLMAVSAGEPAEARKYASRADRLLKAPKLTGLLAAQAAYLAGDHQAARRYFTSLLDDRETAFLGHIGLMRVAVDDKDSTKARDAARAALAIKPESVLAASHLLRLETRRADWQAALPALDVISKGQTKTKSKVKSGNAVQKATLLRQRGAIEFLQAGDLMEKDRSAAIKALVASLKTDSSFLPALIMLADLYLEDKAHAKAAKILETGFSRAPHPSIAERLKLAWKSNDGQFVARLVKQLNKVDIGLRRLAYHVVAEQARAVGMDGEAERLLWDARDLSGKVGADSNKSNLDDDAWPSWQCDSCKSINEDWQPFCPACDEFATLIWQRPKGATPFLPSV
jgi:HemY protein